MTAKRDLKKRVRDRQAKTGESYTAALRHVLAAKLADEVEADTGTEAGTEAEADANAGSNAGPDAVPGTDAGADTDADTATSADADADADADAGGGVSTGAASTAVDADAGTDADAHAHAHAGPDTDAMRAASSDPIAVDSLVDVSVTAIKVGLRCQVLMTEALAGAFDPERILLELRSTLLASLRDPTTDLLRAVALHGDTTAAPLGRARDPRQVHFLARVRAGASAISSDGRALGFHIDGVAMVCSIWRHQATLVVTTLEDMALLTLSGLGTGTVADLKAAPILRFEDQRIPMIKPKFLIGRAPTCDLQIRDGLISRQHAEVLRTDRGWFIKDLESEAGIHYKGMQIENKRIEDGDVFSLGPYELRFTYGG